MTSRPHADDTAIERDAINAFLALSRTYLLSTEQTANPLALGRSMLQRTLTYSRDTTHEIVTRAHREAAQLMTRQIVCRTFH